MSLTMKHKDQHIVPKCYLKNFIDYSIETKNPNHEQGIYITEKNLDNDFKEKNIKHRIFTKSYYYDLSDNKNDIKSIEKLLGTIETRYGSTISKFKKGIDDPSHMEIFKIFTYYQYIRSVSFIEKNQGTFDTIARYMDDFNGNSDTKNQVVDLAKKNILNAPSPTHPIFEQPCRVLLNNTPQIFITADKPVLLTFINHAEAKILFGDDAIIKEMNNSITKPLFYLALTPRIGFVSCYFLDKNSSLNPDHSLDTVIRLNILICLHAEKYIFASIKKPFPNQSEYALEISHQNRPRKQAEILTINNKYIIDITNPIHKKWSMTFTTLDKGFLSTVKENDNIQSIQIAGTGGMRECFVKNINKITGDVEIETYIKFGN